MSTSFDWRSRSRAAGLHLLISAAVAALAAILVFGLWYPGSLRHLAGGQGLFLLVTSVDVVLGPVLTFAVFNLAKGWQHLRRDLLVIGIVQLLGLAYGLQAVYVARPVAVVFEVDRFRVVTAHNVDPEELAKAPPEYRQLPLTGPWLLGTRAPKAGAERNDAMFTALGGADIGQRPVFWQPYEASVAAALARARPLNALLDHYPQQASDWRRRLGAMKVDPSTARFLPVVARGDWVAIIDAKGGIVGYLPAEGFF